MVKLLKDIKEINPKKNYKVAITDSLDWKLSRKVLELAANFEDLDIDLYVPKGKLPKSYSAVVGAHVSNQAANSGSTVSRKLRVKPKVVHVKVTDNTKPIRDIVEDMKRKVDIANLGIQVRSIKTNKEGGIKIFTKGTDNAALKEFASQIQSKVEGVVARSETTLENSVIIRNIDIATDIKEVAAAIARGLGREASEFEERINLRITFKGDAQSAILKMCDQDLTKLGKSLRLGWTDCIIEKMVIPKRCYNCYGYGHIAKDCTQEKFEVRGMCRRCNLPDHNSKACQTQLNVETVKKAVTSLAPCPVKSTGT